MNDETKAGFSQKTPGKKPIPTLSKILIEHPLYEKIEYGDDDPEALKLMFPKGTIDARCSGCKAHSIFTLNSNLTTMRSDWSGEYYFNVDGKCTRNSLHRLHFRFLVIDSTIQKIGQFPSVADLNIHEVKKYAKVLSEGSMGEFVRAIGLAAHGVGVGSFVYLRRIFEGLIEEAHKLGKNEVGWDEDAYQRAKVKDKIDLLAHHLPEFLVQNKQLYSIMSKGVHELTEAECLAVFPAVRVAIEMILDARLEERAKAEKLKAAQAAIQQWNKDLS